MNEDNLKALLKYRMEQADDTLKEAEILFEKASYRGAINRAYYSMFYSVLALLSTKKLGSSKHSGVISLFDREFVKTGLFSRDKSRSLRRAFDRRQTHDYGELIEIEEDVVHDTLEDAKGFVQSVKQYISSAGYA